MKKFILKIAATSMLLGAGFVSLPQEETKAAVIYDAPVTTQSVIDPGDGRP
jgi:hypothetical protein